jgi:pimeloyl-ACP methyl ester carboxylesterase
VAPSTHPWPPAAAPATLVREAGELAAAGLLAPLGWSDRGSRAAARLLAAASPPASGPGSRTPVVLVHGYGGSRAGWLPLGARLARAGFVHVHATTYNPFTTDLPGIARALVADCSAALDLAGADRVHVVGHSLGGVVLRYAARHLGLARRIGTAVTVASPHGGTPVARLGRGPVAAALRPGSPVLTDLRRGASADGVRWVAYYSDADLVVGPGSGRLDEPALHAQNVLVPDVGHLGILRAPLFLDSVTALLAADPVARLAPRAAAA